MYACMHVCMYACMDVWMHVCMYVCMHACMYVFCMYVCMSTSLPDKQSHKPQAEYDMDESGEIDQEEFEALIRTSSWALSF